MPRIGTAGWSIARANAASSLGDISGAPVSHATCVLFCHKCSTSDAFNTSAMRCALGVSGPQQGPVPLIVAIDGTFTGCWSAVAHAPINVANIAIPTAHAVDLMLLIIVCVPYDSPYDSPPTRLVTDAGGPTHAYPLNLRLYPTQHSALAA